MRSSTPAPARPAVRTGRASRRLGWIGLGLLATLVVVAVAAPLLAPHDPTARVGVPFSRPSAAHLLGTDDVGHDLLSVLVHGARVTLVVGIVSAAVATVIGTAVGVVAGSARGVVDVVAMRAVDVVLSLPFLPLMIVVGVFLGPGLRTEVLVIAAVMWAAPARELRAQVLSVRQREHVLSARSMGASPVHTMWHHVGPTVVPLVVPQFVVAARRAILFEAALSFLGLGAAATPSWGTMLSSAQARSAFLTDSWLWWVLPPGIGIALAVLAFAFIGEGIEAHASPPLAPRGRALVAGSATTAAATTGSATAPLLAIEDLTITWPAGNGRRTAVDHVTLSVGPGEAVGLVGESGAGKTTLTRAAIGLLGAPARVEGGSVHVHDLDLLRSQPRHLRRILGRQVASIPQDAINALNPVHRIGDQVAEAITTHHDLPRDAVHARVEELLTQVGIDPARIRAWPHELSGGMRQRVVVAMALANDPELLVADEPTSGIDVIVQAELVALLRRLRTQSGLALLIVTHDLPLVMGLADRVAVMHRGRIVEEGAVDVVGRDPRHDRTRQLLASVPRLASGRTSRDRVGR